MRLIAHRANNKLKIKKSWTRKTHTHIAIYPQGGKKKEKAEKNSNLRSYYFVKNIKRKRKDSRHVVVVALCKENESK